MPVIAPTPHITSPSHEASDKMMPCHTTCAPPQAIFFSHAAQLQSSRGHVCRPARVTVRLVNFSQSALHIRQLKAPCIGKLATIKGTIIRISPVKPMITCMDLMCGKCGSQVACGFPDGKYMPPTKCSGGGQGAANLCA
jgi:DNA replicative helicase MCM subunit Mcm2 (Cdc46/Mcm family)